MTGEHAWAYLRVDRDGTIAELDPAWEARANDLGLSILRSAELVAQPLESFLAPKLVNAWRTLLPQLLQGAAAPPPSPEQPLSEVRFWPAEHGVWLGINRRTVRSWLARPLLRLEKGTCIPCNRAAEQVLGRDIRLAEVRQLESYLATRPSPLRLAPVPGLRYLGKALFCFGRPSLYEIQAFDLIARIVRAGLHDLSNPLSAMRMMAEVSGQADFSIDAPPSLYDMTAHLEGSIDTIHDLRSLIYPDSSAVELDAKKEARLVASLLRSEIARRDLSLAVEGPLGVAVTAGRSAFRLMIAAGVLATCGYAAPASKIRLVCDDPAAPRLRCFVDGECRTALAEEVGAKLLERLVVSCDGYVEIAPVNGRAGGAPHWSARFTAP